MNLKNKILDKFSIKMKNIYNNDYTGHDWWHLKRVLKMSRKLARGKKVNLLVIELAALLHEIYDWKFKNKSKVLEFKKELKNSHIKSEEIKHIFQIIKNISFKGAGVKDKLKTLEGKIVQDADRLDALGAIGIARTFSYGGVKGIPIYDPKMKPLKHKNFTEYKNSGHTSINHFYEKLLLLKARLNTKEAKIIAKKRHQFLKIFLKQFYKEWWINC